MLLLPFGDCAFQEVYSRHALEHLRKAEALVALKEMWRVLQRSGRLHLIVPNLTAHLKQLVENCPPLNEATDGRTWALHSIYGWGGNAGEHRWGYIEATLKEVLEAAGFGNVRRIYTSLSTPNLKLQEFHLEMEAYK